MKAISVLGILCSAYVLSTNNNPSLRVNLDAVLTASDMDWDKIQIEFDVEADEVVVLQRKSKLRTVFRVERAAKTSQYILLKPENGGSIRDSIGDVFLLDWAPDSFAYGESTFANGADSGDFEVRMGKNKFRWDFQKMKFDDVVKLVPELAKLADYDKFVFKGDGSIIGKPFDKEE